MHPLPRMRVGLLALLLVAALLLPACGARKAASPTAPRLVLTLLDVSGSTETTREAYQQKVERIVRNVPAGARLVILPVSGRSLTTPAIFDATLPSYRWWETNSFTHGRQMKQIQQEALDAVGALVETKPASRGTALLDSLLQAQAFLKTYPEGSGSLYIISDMVEQSDLLDLYDLEPDGVEPALAKAEEAGRLPALYGASITVAGLEAAGHLPPERVRAIKSFWEQLFSRAGADLRWYSPTLQLPEQL